jgi:hypothetical protein
VLVESPLASTENGEKTTFIGTSCRYAPVELTGKRSDEGAFIDVIAGATANGRIVGECS